MSTKSAKPDVTPARSSLEQLGERMAGAWDRFWFTPADPTVLGLIRVCCGLITLYTIWAYSFNLEDFFGEHAWWNLPDARKDIALRPWKIDPLRGWEPGPAPVNAFQEEYVNRYREKYHAPAPWPYPSNNDELMLGDNFILDHGMDFRLYHMPFPEDAEQRAYLDRFTRRWNFPPAPPYPKDRDEEKWINDYISHYEADPRRTYAMGKRLWSIWYHVTDPFWMRVAHTSIVMIVFLFTIGFATRITSALTWMGSLSYIHRAPMVLFGVDTMMTILLLYLMIGPSGAALSVDRLLARWWSTARPHVIGRWRSWWGKPAENIAPGLMPPAEPEPSVSANFALRLLQVHVCIIYLAAGLSKLLGPAWWNGTAVWGVIANYEFAPMQYWIYNEFLRLLGQNQLVFMLFLTSAGYFTLFFEIGYTFLIWRPATRWVILGMAIILHALIGLFMGLKTFSLMMLVMNMAFLKPEEVRWLLSRVWRWTGGGAK